MKKHTFAAALCGLLTLTSTHLSAQEVDDKYVDCLLYTSDAADE